MLPNRRRRSLRHCWAWMGLKEEPGRHHVVPDAPPPEAERAPRRKDSDEEALKQYALQAVLRQEAESQSCEIKAKKKNSAERSSTLYRMIQKETN